MSRGSFSLGMRASSPGGTTQARPMKRARKSTTYDYTGPLVLPAYGHERQKQRRSHGSFQVPAASRPSAPRDPPPAVSKPALRKPPPAAPARLAVQRVWDRAQYAWPRVKQALEEEYDLVLTEAADETAGLAAWSKCLTGGASAQLLHRVRLARGCSALPGRGPATQRPATASEALSKPRGKPPWGLGLGLG